MTPERIVAALRELAGMWWATITPQDAADYAAMADYLERWQPVVDLAVAHEAGGAGACLCSFCQAVRRARSEAVAP